MLFNQEIDTWNDIVNQTYDIEFDFIAIDEVGRLGVFSTFNRSYRPACVTQSFNQFLSLDKLIDTQPKITTACFAKPSANMASFADWKYYAELGFFAYDNQDVHKTKPDKQYQYDIIFRPDTPLHFKQLPQLSEYLNIIPRFNLAFGDNIRFDKMQATLIE
jgi:hypothetical protein